MYGERNEFKMQHIRMVEKKLERNTPLKKTLMSRCVLFASILNRAIAFPSYGARDCNCTKVLFHNPLPI